MVKNHIVVILFIRCVVWWVDTDVFKRTSCLQVVSMKKWRLNMMVLLK